MGGLGGGRAGFVQQATWRTNIEMSLCWELNKTKKSDFDILSEGLLRITAKQQAGKYKKAGWAKGLGENKTVLIWRWYDYTFEYYRRIH